MQIYEITTCAPVNVTGVCISKNRLDIATNGIGGGTVRK